MKLTASDVKTLRQSFQVCRTVSIDSVVITDGQIRGVSLTGKTAIISPIELSIDKEVKIGISRLAELEKRLSIFEGEIGADAKMNEHNEVSVLTLSSGRSKLQFRCTSEKMIRYPKQNEDTTVVSVKLKKSEVQMISKAVRSLGAETMILAIQRSGEVKVECYSPTREVFETFLDNQAEFEEANSAFVNIYEGDKFVSILEASAKSDDEVQVFIGEFGSATVLVSGEVIIMTPQSNQEDDDE